MKRFFRSSKTATPDEVKIDDTVWCFFVFLVLTTRSGQTVVVELCWHPGDLPAHSRTLTILVPCCVVRAGNGAEASIIIGNGHGRLPHQNNPRQEFCMRPKNALRASMATQPYSHSDLAGGDHVRAHHLACVLAVCEKPSKSGIRFANVPT